MNLLINDLPALRVANESVEVEYDFSVAAAQESHAEKSMAEQIHAGFNGADAQFQATQSKIDPLNQEIHRLTSHADHIDNLAAVGSGILAGLIDVFWVGEFSIDRGTEWGTEKVNSFVESIAKKTGYQPKDGASQEDRLKGAIEHLERKYGAPSDSNTPELGGGRQHHLRDFAHHPTPVGLAFSMLTQFTCKSYGTDTAGAFLVVDVKSTTFIGKDLPQKILFGVVYWFLHLVSDMAGSSSTPGAGTGIPGPILSMLKELSAFPIFRNKDGFNELSEKISKLFNGTLLADRDENGKIIEGGARPFDLRAEIGVAHEFARQALPVIVNECVVRAFYFLRRLHEEVKAKGSFREIEWGKTLPWSNRTVKRMLTISTGTFTAIDLADAAIRAGMKSGGVPATFGTQLVLRVNFVGIGRFAFAMYSDFSMGAQRSELRKARIALLSEQLHWANAKVAYRQGEVWLAAQETEISLREAEQMMHQSVEISLRAWQANQKSLHNIGLMQASIHGRNPQLINDIQKLLI